MNLFEKTFNQISGEVKKTIDKIRRKKQLQAQYKLYVAEKEAELLEEENNLENRISINCWSFSELMEMYTNILTLKEQLAFAKKTYDYVFEDVPETKK